jgi:lysophospholipid acyltransferase (LPLAT)-like uncharacterized protein
MLKRWKNLWKKCLPFFITTIGQRFIRLIIWTCHWKVEGLEKFQALAGKERCILMLWHDHLALIPFILSQYAPQYTYAALVSNSRDGKLLSAVIRSYPQARTIVARHDARHQALREVIRHLEEKQDVVIMTPDGPRGPRHQVKPGIAMAALQTAAYVIPLRWTASHYWALNTWDQLKLPKPFSSIHVIFEEPLRFTNKSEQTLEQVQEILQKSLYTKIP